MNPLELKLRQEREVHYAELISIGSEYVKPQTRQQAVTLFYNCFGREPYTHRVLIGRVQPYEFFCEKEGELTELIEDIEELRFVLEEQEPNRKVYERRTRKLRVLERELHQERERDRNRAAILEGWHARHS